LSRKISAGITGGRGGGRGRGRRNSGQGGRGNGQGRNGQSGHSSQEKTSAGYYSTAEWEKLSFDERDKIHKERDKKGEQGGSKRTISELTTKQLTTAIISSIQKANADNGAEDTPKQSNASQAGNAFGEKKSAKRSKTG
jgi:hypothetical protein